MRRQVHPDNVAGAANSRAGIALPGDLLRKIYAATLTPDFWVRVMMLVAPLLGCEKAMAAGMDRDHPQDSFTETIGFSPQAAVLLRERDVAEDRIWQAARQLRPGTVCRSTDLLPLEPALRGSLYQQLAGPEDLRFFIAAVLESRPETFACIGFLRSKERGEFTAAEFSLLSALTPQLQVAAALARRVMLGDAARREALLSFDRAGQALVVLDRSGYAIHVNAAAWQLLERLQGVAIKQGRFLFDSLATQAEFEHGLRQAVAAVDGTAAPPMPLNLRLSQRIGAAPLALSLLPCVDAADRAVVPPGAGCLVLLFDPDRQGSLPVAWLERIYGLTAAELRVCEALFHNADIDAAADALGLSHHTVRSHLKGIYAKFGVANQGQLLQRLAHSLRVVAPGNDVHVGG